MSDNEVPIELPSGGKAWAAKLITHERDQIMSLYWRKRGRYFVEEPIPGSDQMRTIERPGLTSDEIDDLAQLDTNFRDVFVRARVLRWEGVRDPDGNELAFPDDVGRMRTDDFNELFVAASRVARGEEFPNSTGPSDDTSSPASGPKTRSSQSSSTTS